MAQSPIADAKLSDLEIPLLEARGLANAMIMALAGKEKVSLDHDGGDPSVPEYDALERLAIAIEHNIGETVKLWDALRSAGGC